ncbi:MAG TPA: radical SAM protein [Syntrophales bacterium]|nr:radical SAM protein [Syntrophales bacterium]HOM06151.1 radical SAM protein [Syntrophales bacterium]HPC01005.1 radical SAM protein [Syntrophales bacterium]HPQ05634.1 radical SAM protein [Syntrophales bacterium]HRS86106.1 radical SAM protein [Syntrophales bacterium]
MILLISPPVSRPSEPPAGIAALLGALRKEGVACRGIDLSLEGLLYLLSLGWSSPDVHDRWTGRAFRHRREHLASLRKEATYRHPDRYRRAVADLERVLGAVSSHRAARVGLADYGEEGRSPLRSSDLLGAAEEPEGNVFFPFFTARLSRVLMEENPDTVGISINYLGQALTAFAVIGWLRREVPRLRIVLGGGLITSWLHRPAAGNPFGGLADLVCPGPGEGTLLHLAGREGGGWTARPCFDDFPLGDYLSPGVILPVAASRGCYWRRCRFCPEAAEGNPHLSRRPAQVLGDLAALGARHAPALFHFVDSAMSPALLSALAGSDNPYPWSGFARVGAELADPDFCRLLGAAGCVMLEVGVESGSQRVLDALDKGIDLATASRALKALKGAGIGTYVYLLFGTPPEGREDAEKTLSFVAENALYIDYINVALFNLPRGTADEGLETRPFSDDDLSLYEDFVHPRGWGRREVRLFLDRVFRRHGAVAPILKRRPPVFTSSHAPFFLSGKAPGPPLAETQG